VSSPFEPTGQSFDSAHFRQILGHFPTGVTIITAMADDEPVGLAVGSFFSISLDPPLVGFCAARASTSFPKVAAYGSFCANILASDQEAVSRVFASSGADKFRGLAWKPSPGTGSPVLGGVVAWIDCAIDEVHEAGDHQIVVGRVHDLELGQETAPIVFFRGGYHRLAG
jgi:flavin reductase (DIM6/NTAB) family NADH-FMN oxidoreductase RutF